jgi:hypothetical protein
MRRLAMHRLEAQVGAMPGQQMSRSTTLFARPFLLALRCKRRQQPTAPRIRHLPCVFRRFPLHCRSGLRSCRPGNLVRGTEKHAHKWIFHDVTYVLKKFPQKGMSNFRTLVDQLIEKNQRGNTLKKTAILSIAGFLHWCRGLSSPAPAASTPSSSGATCRASQSGADSIF